MAGRKVLLGITGSIAAYKIIQLVRLLTKAGAEVKVVMTPAARDFVSPLVLETLSRHPVHHALAESGTWANHVMLGRWADLMLVAPASCNSIGKMAAGLCDNLLMAVYLSATCPVWVAPAMDEDMWKHPATRENLARLEGHGVRVLGVGSGDLASGLVGEGRMQEPEQLMLLLQDYFGEQHVLAGKTAIVTAGPTYEPIDPVRFIGNHSSGRMGIEVAQALATRGARTTLVLGPSNLPVPPGMDVVRVQTAAEMFDAVKQRFSGCDIAVMAAAVADYRPATAASEKIKKTTETLQISLVKNPDILKYCGENKTPQQLVVGFALETQDEEQNARTKLAGKNADLMVLNSLRDEGAGFGTATNKISIFDREGPEYRFPLGTKSEAAKQVADLIVAKMADR
jgi:phosphopantothenoylcysteine decarboxylase/phosphopantothenate--cysteine ligase